MHGGYDSKRKAYYLKTDDGLWMSCGLDYDTGDISLKVQDRLIDEGDKYIVIDHDDEEMEIIYKRPGMFPPVGWRQLVSISVDRPEFVTDGVRKYRRDDVYKAVCSHAILRMLRGSSPDEALLPMQNMDGDIMEAGEYLIIDEPEFLGGLMGEVFLVKSVGDKIEAEIGIGRDIHEVVFEDQTLALFMATVPVVE